jgi:hypothetical protein
VLSLSLSVGWCGPIGQSDACRGSVVTPGLADPSAGNAAHPKEQGAAALDALDQAEKNKLPASHHHLRLHPLHRLQPSTTKYLHHLHHLGCADARVSHSSVRVGLEHSITHRIIHPSTRRVSALHRDALPASWSPQLALAHRSAAGSSVDWTPAFDIVPTVSETSTAPQKKQGGRAENAESDEWRP